MLNVNALFDEFLPEPPASDEAIAALATVLALQLPRSYVAFLRASNGGWGRSGGREFGLFSTEDVGRYLRDYEFAEYMPGAVPFALDGGGTFYVLDLRGPLTDQECPVFTCDAGANFWANAHFLAASFPAACRNQ